VATAIVSDLHLGAARGHDLLRRPAALRALVDALGQMDELVLLGDVVELRKSPLAKALAAATPPLREIGRALAGRRVTIVPGNHDHELAAPLLESIRLRDGTATLALDSTAPPPPTGPLAAVADALAPAEVRVAYPGVWLRPDVYATHGHYLDVHNAAPNVERMAIGAVKRAIGGLPEGRMQPADYEAMVRPVYALTYELAQSSRAGREVSRAEPSLRVWKAVQRKGVRRVPALLVGGVAVPLVLAGLNRAGVGPPFSADLSGTQMRRAALEAMVTVVSRLGIEADHVIFGHTHRHGPRKGEKGWDLPGGRRLINTGSWLVERAFLGEKPDDSPYWPGHMAVVPDEGEPRLVRLLDAIPKKG
jgi:predicted phosphodiesterase